ncbi:putative transcription factor interactor and regulator CCHC(Zn) family [Helianthus annuus]|nr:putative transcription factor interactor and regulator CCHC(Zn) family [Helianthus annuus]KAJ0626165.1 putative transcription factor interactor and regulator CCHC(Zn) family [Helianthus annuus]KAJ0782498.1 putative transcription factor interactor and regulator CCHC(Zn) family [Helianthus annuus]
MQMEELHTTNASTNRQLLNALPKSWDHHVVMIKKTKDLARCSLSEMISHIKACELDGKQRETNYKNSMLAAGFSATPLASSNNTALVSHTGFQMFSNSASAKAAPTSSNTYYSGTPTPTTAAPSTPNHATAAASSTPTAKNEMIVFFSQQSKENHDIVASVVNCLNAFAAGRFDPPKFSMGDLDQIHPEDVEEMDITWQMAMAAFRAKNFVRKTGRNKWQNLTFTGPTKMPFELRCYNCHEPGHLAKNCNKPNVNREQTPAQPVTPNRERALVTTSSISADAIAGGSPQPQGLAQALVVQPGINFDWNSEIERLNISAPENQADSNNIAFMTSNDQVSVSEDETTAPEEETSVENLAFMTQILSAPVKGLTKEEVLSVFCTPECRELVEAYRIHNAELIEDYNDIKRKKFTLANNEKFLKKKLKLSEKTSSNLRMM